MTKKVVIVEDNELNMKLFKGIFNIVSWAEFYYEMDGKKGLELILEIQPDVIILDIKLPSMSGVDICNTLRAMDGFKDVPILAVTASAMKDEKEEIMKVGFDRFITKPIRVKSFRDYVKCLLFD